MHRLYDIRSLPIPALSYLNDIHVSGSMAELSPIFMVTKYIYNYTTHVLNIAQTSVCVYMYVCMYTCTYVCMFFVLFFSISSHIKVPPDLPLIYIRQSVTMI